MARYFFCLLFFVVYCLLSVNLLYAKDLTLIIECKRESAARNGAESLWPVLFIKNNNLCFDVTGMMNYKGYNCLDKSQSAYWSGVFLLFIDGESMGRDETEFRVKNAKFTDQQIAYVIEWRRKGAWQVFQTVEINRLTGNGVDWFVNDHGGYPITCQASRKKF